MVDKKYTMRLDSEIIKPLKYMAIDKDTNVTTEVTKAIVAYIKENRQYMGESFLKYLAIQKEKQKHKEID